MAGEWDSHGPIPSHLAIEQRLQVAPADYGKPLRHSARGLWSLRVGDRRIIYQLKDTQILIIRVGHRREVYLPFV